MIPRVVDIILGMRPLFSWMVGGTGDSVVDGCVETTENLEKHKTRSPLRKTQQRVALK